MPQTHLIVLKPHNHHSKAPICLSGHLQVESKKLGPRLIGSFKIQSVINQAAVRLKLPCFMNIQPTFHISWICLTWRAIWFPHLCHLCVLTSMMVDQPICNTCSALAFERCHQYLVVNCEGHGPEEESGMPAHHILNPVLIVERGHWHPEDPLILRLNPSLFVTALHLASPHHIV